MAIHDLSATELIAAYARKAISPVEATKAIVAHIETWEPHLRATYAFDPEGALEAAALSEARWLKGDTAGALDGVPTMIKENIATKGVPVPLGTAATQLVPATADAPPAARLREAGAVILGKTTMPDYGMSSSGLSSFHALTRNPWDLAFNPGGSSAGAGAGAAAGYGPLHIGTDIGGSVRLPAAWCGLFGFKPSNGRVPIDPPYYGRIAGPLTRTVSDAALMMSVLARPDRRDHMSLPSQDLAWLDLDRDVKGLTFGLLEEIGCGMPVKPEVKAAIAAAARRFEAAGARVERMEPFLTPEMLNGLDDFWRSRAYADLITLPKERRDAILPFYLEWAGPAADFSGQKVFHGLSQMPAMASAAVKAFAKYDFVLSPTAPIAGYPAELGAPTDDPARPFEHIGFTVAYNMSEQPAATICCGYTSAGLPIGLQIIGHRHDDIGVLAMSRAFERMRDPQRPWPTPPK